MRQPFVPLTVALALGLSLVFGLAASLAVAQSKTAGTAPAYASYQDSLIACLGDSRGTADSAADCVAQVRSDCAARAGSYEGCLGALAQTARAAVAHLSQTLTDQGYAPGDLPAFDPKACGLPPAELCDLDFHAAQAAMVLAHPFFDPPNRVVVTAKGWRKVMLGDPK